MARILLHIETGFQINLDLPEFANAQDVALIIKEETGQRIGLITLNNLMKGNFASANGFEIVDAEIKPSENEVSLDEVTLGDKKPEFKFEEFLSEEGDVEPDDDIKEEGLAVDPIGLGDSLAADLVEKKDDLGVKSKDFSATNRRKHTSKEDGLAKAEGSAYSGILAKLKADGFNLSYVHPELKKFKLIISGAETEGEANAMSNKNPHVHLVPNKNGFGVNLFIANKRVTGRFKFDSEDTLMAGLADLLKEGGEFHTLINK